MKRCPTCKMIVDADNECPFCATTLTYEPQCEAVSEHLVWNKYLFFSIVKNTGFSVICCVVGLLKVFIARPQTSALLFTAGACAVISLIVSIFQRNLCKTMTWKYSEEYIPFKIGIWKYLLGVLSIILFIFL